MKLALNQTGALLLGAAINKLFPHAEFEGSHADSFEFRATFSDTERFDPSYLPLIENTMRDLSKEEVSWMEMVAANAAELFQHLGLRGIAKRMDKGKQIVSVGRLGKFADLCEQGEACTTFSLLLFEQKKGKVTVYGVAFDSPRDKKVFLKKFSDYPKKEGTFLAKELDFFEGETWHPRGIRLKKHLTALLEDLLSKNGFEEVSTNSGLDYFEATGRNKFYCFDQIADLVYSFDPDTSLLHLLDKWMIICGLEHRWVLRCSKQPDPLMKAVAASALQVEKQPAEGGRSSLELHIADALGRFWPGPSLHLEKKGMKASFFGEIEPFITLLIERYGGELPFHLAPEQVWLIPMEGVDLTEIFEIFNRLNIRYLVDRSKILLKEKIHLALRLKVPYVMVFGKDEDRRRQMSIRACGSSQEQKVTLEAMETLLAERQIESQ